MADFRVYQERLFIKGINKRERNKNYFKQDLINRGIENGSYKSDTLINGELQPLFINSGTKPYYKKIRSLPDNRFYAGQYVDFANSKWLILNADYDNEYYVDGNMQQCNYEMRWQDENRNIITRHAVVKSASQYNTGETESRALTIGYNQLMVYVPLDEDTIKLKSDKRFFIDVNKENPTVYRLTRVETVIGSYNGVGYIEWLCTEHQYNQEVDSIEHMTCDYKEPFVSEFNLKYYGSDSVGIGFSKTFIAEIDDNIIEWNISDNVKDNCKLSISGNSCKVTVDENSDLINQKLIITCKDSKGKIGKAEITISGGI